MNLQDFLGRCLLLDLETSTDQRIWKIGAELRGHALRCQGKFELREALAALDRLAQGADFVLGHNLLDHDLPVLRERAPGLGLLRKPVVDTLVLSPLAFPENPYHRLVKGYKLVRDAASDPLADARLAARLFADQWRSFAELGAAEPERLAFYAFCLAALGGSADAEAGRGLASLLELHAGRPMASLAEARAYLDGGLAGQGCSRALAAAAMGLERPEDRPPWAFTAAWLRVAGSNSVVPRWVCERHPRVAELADALRGRPCGGADCAFCRGHHDPAGQLRRFFDLGSFREQPAAADGTSLQRAVVGALLESRPTLALLPTGGGKSICYQLPALMRHRQRGLLTIVISPLQALMQDQVEQLNRRTESSSAAAINGLLTPPERGATLERVRLGDVAILYVSPEQLRNPSFAKAVEQREIGAWVFDEAHCLSKWGHDFRPDYLYAARFIRELAGRQRRPPPPVAGFTATAKPDVVGEIAEHFRGELGIELEPLGGNFERPELSFSVEEIPPARGRKLERIEELVGGQLAVTPGAAVIVYFATRRASELGAEHLRRASLPAAAFHAGLKPPEKRRILEQFVARELPVVCATNAFGMGIDKEDVRLVVHADLPGSLESYQQEAGRAGRDRLPARCVLLFDPDDVERQFQLAAQTRLNRRDLAQILRGLRRLGRRTREGGDPEVIVTSRELLQSEEVDTTFDRQEPGADTKVRTAVAWLERAGFIQRNQNRTRVFQGRPRVASLAEASERIAALRPALLARRREQWLAVLAALFNCEPDQGLTADQLAELPAFAAGENEEQGAQRKQEREAQEEERDAQEEAHEAREEALEPPGEAEAADGAREHPGERVLAILHQMAELGLIESGLQLTAYVQRRGRGAARSELELLEGLESELLRLLAAEQKDAPSSSSSGSSSDAGAGDGWCAISLRRLNQSILAGQEEKESSERLTSDPDRLRRLLQELARELETRPGRAAGLELVRRDRRHQYAVRARGGWEEIAREAANRRRLAQGVVEALLERAPADSAGPVLVAFGVEDLVAALRKLRPGDSRPALLAEDEPLPAIERALLFLHEHKVIQLHQGLAVFRQAMTIRVRAERKGQRYGESDFAPLAAHYRERTFQIHVMARYAEIGKSSIEGARALVRDYFTLDKASFVARHFAAQEAMLARATGTKHYEAIVEKLANQEQIELVTAPADANLLVLAGPGAGKTRVVVHRCAYLLRVERVPARAILGVCFNRGAAREVARRLRELVGEDARGVLVATYHGLALHLTGTSLAEIAARGGAGEPDFDGMIAAANEMLRGPQTAAAGAGSPAADESGDEGTGEEGIAEPLRERLLAGFSHILVDEYQDINEAQYELVSNLAGRALRQPERRLSILAVGDDDQTIYGFQGAKVEFIRRFESDYGAKIHYLVENYRSSGHIVEAANLLIERSAGRIKKGHPIQVDALRTDKRPGGRWTDLDREGRGRVQIVSVADAACQAAAVAELLDELRRLDSKLSWGRCAVLARTHEELEPIRALLENRKIPLVWSAGREQLPPLHRIREIARFLGRLAERRGESFGDAKLAALLMQVAAAEAKAENPWFSLLRELLEEWRLEVGDGELSGAAALDFFYDALAEWRREARRGEGVHLGTVHGAKGQEFGHVVIAGGGWMPRGAPPAPSAAAAVDEEERRLFYVGMTRAQETLHLLWRRDQENPHVQVLAGSATVWLREPAVEPPPAEILARRFKLLDLSDVFIDYAGWSDPDDPIHRRLERLQPGSPLWLEEDDLHVFLRDGSGGRVGRLSEAARKGWASNLAAAVEEVRVVALVERRREDSAPEFRDRLHSATWLVPLAEIRYRAGALAPAARRDPPTRSTFG